MPKSQRQLGDVEPSTRIPTSYEGLKEHVESLGKPEGSVKTVTPASQALHDRQMAAHKLVRRVLADEILSQRHYEGAEFTSDDRAAISKKVRDLVGVSGKSAEALDGLTRSILLGLSANDKARATRALMEGSAAVANTVGASPLWEAPEVEEGSDMDPAELAKRIVAR